MTSQDFDRFVVHQGTQIGGQILDIQRTSPLHPRMMKDFLTSMIPSPILTADFKHILDYLKSLENSMQTSAEACFTSLVVLPGCPDNSKILGNFFGQKMSNVSSDLIVGPHSNSLRRHISLVSKRNYEHPVYLLLSIEGYSTLYNHHPQTKTIGNYIIGQWSHKVIVHYASYVNNVGSNICIDFSRLPTFKPQLSKSRLGPTHNFASPQQFTVNPALPIPLSSNTNAILPTPPPLIQAPLIPAPLIQAPPTPAQPAQPIPAQPAESAQPAQPVPAQSVESTQPAQPAPAELGNLLMSILQGSLTPEQRSRFFTQANTPQPGTTVPTAVAPTPAVAPAPAVPAPVTTISGSSRYQIVANNTADAMNQLAVAISEENGVPVEDVHIYPIPMPNLGQMEGSHNGYPFAASLSHLEEAQPESSADITNHSLYSLCVENAELKKLVYHLVQNKGQLPDKIRSQFREVFLTNVLGTLGQNNGQTENEPGLETILEETVQEILEEELKNPDE